MYSPRAQQYSNEGSANAILNNVMSWDWELPISCSLPLPLPLFNSHLLTLVTPHLFYHNFHHITDCTHLGTLGLSAAQFGKSSPAALALSFPALPGPWQIVVPW